MQLNTQTTMSLTAILLFVILTLVGKSVEEVATEGCSFETLRREAVVDRCFDHLDHKSQHLDKELAPVETNCVIKCKHGEGVTYRVCDSGGYWNGPGLKCVGKHDANREIKRRQKRGFWWNRSSDPAPPPVRCSRPAAPNHGSVLGTADRYGDGDVVKFSCNTGYRLTAGSRERICRRSGWTGNKPTCTLVTCSRPSAPSNGYITLSDYAYGDVVRYYCNTGYTRYSGDSSRTCGYHGWSGTTAYCTRVTCGRLPDPAHGDVMTSGREYGDYATYSCDMGYTMTGYYRRSCDSDGYWSGSRPSCTRISCGRPSAPGHGSISAHGYQYRDVVRYSCRSDYTLTGGSSARTCHSRGYWTGTKPSCVFSNTCRSNPCQHGAKCVNGLNRYSCKCTYGWFGTNCEIDTLPPAIPNCPSNETRYISSPTVTLNWTAPTFSNPTIRLTCNYRLSEATFPWGEFVIQYVATKPSNGLRSECLFTKSIYPRPCKSLVVPDNGAVACNGWNGRFGEVCTVLCQQTRDLPPGKDISRLYVCGASGHWTPRIDISACSEPWYGSEGGQSEDLQRHYYSGDCDDQRTEIGEKYIEILKASDMHEMCTSTRWNASCVPEKAKVVCGKNTIV